MAARELHSEIEIDASAERVWEVLTDFESLPDWNPFLRSASGVLEEGRPIEVTIQPPGRRPTTFKPTVLRAEPGRELRWLGKLGLPGLFDGEHAFIIEPKGSDRAHFTQKESFKGILRPLLGGVLRDTQRGFEQMNEALKERAEAAEGGPPKPEPA